MHVAGRAVAVHVEIWKSKKFVTGFSRWVKGQAQGLESGGFKLWVNWIQRVQPHRARDGVQHQRHALVVAAQVAFEKANFETGFSLDRCKG